jgi:hypothetical protein
VARLDYDDWADLLAWHFFKPGNAGRAVFLFVDDDLVAELAQKDDPAEAVADLVAAVRMRLRPEDPFRDLLFEGMEWFQRRTTGSPHCLPLLAISVLAATRMERDGAVGANNYYVRFRELLRLEGRGRPAGYDWALPQLWIGLDHWLNKVMRGDLGRSTIRGHHHWVNVGYAYSQALFRASDRDKVEEFLADGALRPGQPLDGEALLERFIGWSDDARGLSPGLRRMLSDKTLHETLRDIITDVAAGWNGSAPSRGRRTPLQMRMVRDRLGRRSIDLVARRHPGDPALLEATDPRTGTLMRIEGTDSWYDRVPVTLTPELLRSGMTLRAEPMELSFRPQPVRVLVEQPAAGGWISASAALAGFPVVVLAADHLRDAVETYLGAAADDAWDTFSLPGQTGWFVTSAISLKAARPIADDPRLGALTVAASDIFDLAGGLPLGGKSYLVGGPPDVVVGKGVGVPSLPVMVDGRLVGEAEPGVPLSLTSEELTVGDHEIVVGPARRSVHMRVSQEAVRDVYPTVFRLTLPQGSLHIRGAGLDWRPHDLTPSDVAPVVVPRGGQHVLLGSSDGQCLTPSWARPRWMHRVPLHPVRYEVWPSFAPVWLITKRRSHMSVTLLRDAPPTGADSTRTQSEVEAWAAWLRRIDQSLVPVPARDRWLEFVRRANDVYARG